MHSEAARLATALLAGMQLRQLTLSTAESCTGGQLAAAITAVPGSSAIYIGGIVAYSISVKQALLGVPEVVLEQYGAVSEQCAAAMALGCQHGFATSWALSTTGIAGPDGASPDHPVGTVCFGWAHAGGQVRTERICFPGSRAEVQRLSVEHSLAVLLQLLDETA